MCLVGLAGENVDERAHRPHRARSNNIAHIDDQLTAVEYSSVCAQAVYGSPAPNCAR